MRLIQLDHQQRARVWMGELPIAAYDAERRILDSIATPRACQNGTRGAAIELVAPLGARFSYGLLGGELAIGGIPHMAIEVALSNSRECHYVGSLVEDLKEAPIVGLPSEYEPGLRAGIEDARQQSASLCSGYVKINRAAHSVIGSNRAIFRRLIRALLSLLSSYPALEDDAEIRRLLGAR